MTSAVWAQAAAKASTPSTQPAASAKDSVKDITPKAAPAKSFPQVGFVKGNSVYVRSGSNQNYYPVTKLNRGDKVTVVGEEFKWLKIIPPAGTHGLIDKTRVDRVGMEENKGVVNGQTWVIAGSNLNDHCYAKQVKLSKGTVVTIVGTTSDGNYYKISPPAGSHLWISADYVDLTRGSEEFFGPKPIEIKKRLPEPTKIDKSKKISGGKPPANSNKYQDLLSELEKKITAEANKPLNNRVLEPIINELQPIASQTEDKVAQVYAQVRLDQIRKHMKVIAAVQEMRQLRQTAISAADDKTRERAMIKTKEVVPLDRIVVSGEIRYSSIYDGTGNRPLRWRVVDPASTNTLAYIELPENSAINPVDYYGKNVGIRASARRVSRATIPPLPIYTVDKIVLLDEKDKKGQTQEVKREAKITSPKPIEVAAPSSQPARTAKDTKPAAQDKPADKQ